jgi:hypothetical protein
MRFIVALAVLSLSSIAFAQDAPKSTSKIQPKSVTVPITLDHNRVVIEVGLPLPDGSSKPVRGWVNTGNPELQVSPRVAELMGLAVICGANACSAPPPREVTIGGMNISLASVREVQIPVRRESAASVMVPGMSAEISLPSSVLRNYDVLINFPDREFSIGLPGTLRFNGVKSKMVTNPNNGLIQIPSKIENKNYNLGLDAGSSISFLSEDIFDKLSSTHSDWPRMTGAVGPANIWGFDEEPNSKLMRVDRVQYGPLFLTNVAVVDFPKDRMPSFEKQAGISTAGLLGSEALMNYRIGLDYAHSTIYFEIGRTFNFPDFDVIGLILRPEDDGRFTILGVADYEGKPSVPQGQDGVQAGDHLAAVDAVPVVNSTMGQVWSMLGGSPGQERNLTIERAGKQFAIVAKVQHFLAELPEENSGKRKGSTKK